jgi:hypothetical protein
VIRRLRICALAFALAATPACVSLTPLNPFVVARSVDQQAYVLIGAYALALEEASALGRDPATPAVEFVKIAAVAYRQAETVSASAALTRAIAEAQRPIADLVLLVKK